MCFRGLCSWGVRGGNAGRYYGSEYLPNLGENTKAIFILAVLVSSALGAASELLIYFFRHRAVSAWENLCTLLINRFFRAGIAFMLSFIALSAPVFFRKRMGNR